MWIQIRHIYQIRGADKLLESTTNSNAKDMNFQSDEPLKSTRKNVTNKYVCNSD